MRKQAIFSIYEKNKIIANIIDAMVRRDHFLILGHQIPDEDCISSMVAIALLLSKFLKDIRICLGSRVNEHFQYLLNICKHNAIHIVDDGDLITGQIDAIIVCDTPKRSMLDVNNIQNLSLLNSPEVLKIEIDHHIGGDSEYIGEKGYCLVTEASSASELIGHIAFKLSHRKDLLKQFHIANVFSRNLVLTILTGIIGDSYMGKFLNSRREKRYYTIFSNLFNQLLARETTKASNFSSMEEIFGELQKSTTQEAKCFNYMMRRKKFSHSVGYIILTPEDMVRLKEVCDTEAFVAVSRSVANVLADESQKFSLIVYYDDKDSDLVQFRMRRSHRYKQFDLRSVLDLFSIENGGGHEGAIGFRIPKKKILDLHWFVEQIIQGIERAVA